MAKLMTRYITKHSIPDRPMICIEEDCVYCEGYMKGDGGTCDTPWINRGNGDALCHRVRPREVLTWLTEEGNVDLS